MSSATFNSERNSPPTPAAEPAAESRAAHDPTTPQALIDFMLGGWDSAPSAAVEPVRGVERFAARRAALSARFPAEALVIPTGHEKVRANDTYFRFRPGTEFYYLTGNTEPDCVLVMLPRAGGGHDELLFVEPGGRQDASFFTDRKAGELWVGPRLGIERSQARYGVAQCRPLAELPEVLDRACARSSTQKSHRLLRGFSAACDARLAPDDGDAELAQVLSEMRLIKDALEVEELRAAIESTHRGFGDVLAALAPQATERHVEGVFNLRARVEGNDVGYGTIAASGAHACVLHWTKNDGALRQGELLLLDAGVEAHTLYTADITRTIPISGRFSPPQRRIYELVLRAQREAMAAVRPGVDFLEPNRVAMRILTEGLFALGILRVPPEEALREDRQLYRRYTLHNVSHMLGLDVHDCAQARQEAYKHGKLAAGMVLTVEPGLYFQADDLTVPAEYRGIGIRIEDDVLVTPDGHENLSADIPAEPDAVEAWIAASLSASPRR
ncbi:MAG: aminopeptidase P family protein [Candidatus Wallbacteria bacterium]|nr:aminopeptidase P family protein [Candidatus Wallbacteria bacterium]